MCFRYRHLISEYPGACLICEGSEVPYERDFFFHMVYNIKVLMFFVQLCVQNSPQEARNMLLQNPQLAYALLQAQVVMRIVDPEIALVRAQ